MRAGAQVCSLTADHYILTAGEGNEALLPAQFSAPKMQRRPLHMVWLKFAEPRPDHALFVHCIRSGMVPRLTITTHQDDTGKTVWYLGGELAETGVQRSPHQQIQAAKQALAEMLPWVNIADVEWGTVMLDRAEQENAGKRPDHPTVKIWQNLLVCWPTKLTLTPAMTQQVLAHLTQVSHTTQPLPVWPMPAFSKPVWEVL